MLAHSFLIESSSKLLVTGTGIKARTSTVSGLWFPWSIYMFVCFFQMRFDLGTLDSGERSLPFGLLVIHFRSLLFEGNASLKCVYSGLTPLSTVFQSYHDDVWLLQGAQCGLVVPIFIHRIYGFPCTFICLSFMLMGVDFSRTQKGYSVHVFNLYYIVIDLEAGQYFVGRFQNLDYMHY